MKQYVGISRDHSGSMSSLSRFAAKDYNDSIAALKDASQRLGIDTVVSVVECGIRSGVRRAVTNSSLAALKPIGEREYVTDGGTPLFDSVGELIEILKAVPDASDPNVSFLVMVITDGEENQSRRWDGRSLAAEMHRLIATDHWTFTFRVPRGYASNLVRLGIPAANILEWEQSEAGFAEATLRTQSAVSNFYVARAAGQTASRAFYTDLSGVSATKVKQVLTDVSRDVQIWDVRTQAEIRPFVEGKLHRSMRLGAAFYELNKPEPHVQDYKKIAIRNRKDGKVYAGREARDLLNLPHYGDIRLSPGMHGEFDVFVQSTSVNRKLYPGTKVLYWEGN